MALQQLCQIQNLDNVVIRCHAVISVIFVTTLVCLFVTTFAKSPTEQCKCIRVKYFRHNFIHSAIFLQEKARDTAREAMITGCDHELTLPLLWLAVANIKLIESQVCVFASSLCLVVLVCSSVHCVIGRGSG